MKRPFVTMGGCFLASAWVSSTAGDVAQVLLLVTGLLGFFVCLGFAPRRVRGMLCCGFLFAGLAAGLFFVRTQQDLAVSERVPLDEKTEITGTVTDIEARSNHRYTYYLTVERMRRVDERYEPTEEPIHTKFQTILYSNVYLDVTFYDEITLPVSFFAPTDSQAFDSVRYYQSRGVYLLAHFDGDGAAPMRLDSPEKKPLLYYFKTHHRALGEKIDQAMSPTKAAVLKSMVLGDSSGVSDTLREQYVRSGVVHLFAISGMHISILAGFLRLLFGVFFVGRGRHYFGSVLGQMLVLGGFVALTGMRVSAVRAGLMLLIMLSGSLFARRPEGTNSLCFAGLVILLFDPYAILDLGFIMSFLATLGILTVATPLSDWCIERFSLRGDLPRLVIYGASVSTAANVFLLPVYATTFRVLPVLFIPANIVTTLTATVIIVTGFVLVWVLSICIWIPAGMIVSALSTALRSFFFLLEQMIALQNNMVAWFSRIPFATMGLDDPILRVTLVLCVGLMAGAVLLHRLAPRGKNPGLLRPGAMLCALVFLAGSTLSMRAQSGRVFISLIGDGETSNLVIIKDYSAVVISPKDSDYIDQRTYRYLRERGVRRIDTLVLLYDELVLYEDTMHLVENMPVQNILYHRASMTATTLLDGHADALVAIGHQGEVGIPTSDEIRLSFSYYYNLIDTTISCYGVEMLLTSHIPTLQQTPTDLALVRGNVNAPLVDIPTSYLVVTQRQWDPIVANVPYHLTSQTPLELVITPDGILRPSNRLFLPAKFSKDGLG